MRFYCSPWLQRFLVYTTEQSAEFKRRVEQKGKYCRFARHARTCLIHAEQTRRASTLLDSVNAPLVGARET
jgi:hypothetical protein